MAMEKHFIQEGIIRSKIISFLKNELGRAGYSGINIQKTPLATRVILYVEKPPLVIGKKGKRINRLTEILREKYGLDNPTLDVQKVENPIMDANIVARRIAVALERGINRRRVAHKAIRAVMGSGARGIEIILAGKIIGKGGRAKSEKYAQGYMKRSGDCAKLVGIGRTQAYLKAGVIGVTVRIVPPDVIFPDQISVFEKPKEETKLDETLVEKTMGVLEKEEPEKKLEEKPKRKRVKKTEKEKAEGAKRPEEKPTKVRKARTSKKEKSDEVKTEENEEKQPLNKIDVNTIQ